MAGARSAFALVALLLLACVREPARAEAEHDTWREQPVPECASFDRVWQRRRVGTETYPGTTTAVLVAARADLDEATAFDAELARATCPPPAFAVLARARRAALFDRLFQRLEHTEPARYFDVAQTQQIQSLLKSTDASEKARGWEMFDAEVHAWMHGKLAVLDEIAARMIPMYIGAFEAARRARTGRFPCRASLGRLAFYTERLGDGRFTPYPPRTFVRLRPVVFKGVPEVAQVALEVGEPERALPVYERLTHEHPEDFVARRGLAETRRALGEAPDPLLPAVPSEDLPNVPDPWKTLDEASQPDLRALLEGLDYAADRFGY